MNVISLGTFDLFHIGHLKLLKKCREIGSYVVIGLNTDEFIEKYKGRRPIMTYSERESMLLETGLVDEIIPNDQPNGDAKGVILKAVADIIVVGSDWARKDYVGQIGVDWDWLDEYDVSIMYVKYTQDISSTEIKKRLNANLLNHTNAKS